jgi:hypothetical protein
MISCDQAARAAWHEFWVDECFSREWIRVSGLFLGFWAAYGEYCIKSRLFGVFAFSELLFKLLNILMKRDGYV